jgi:hypothetical protein
MRPRLATLIVVLLAAACGGPAGATQTTGGATPTPKATPANATIGPGRTATAAPNASSAPTASASPAPVISIVGDVVTINADALAPLFYAPAVATSTDPFYHIHTVPASDGFSLSIEAYTVYGPLWTGQMGTFAIQCTATGTGICVHFDADGPGPKTDLGLDFLVTGSITFAALTATTFDVTLTGVTFSDGTTIPGPLHLTKG